MSQNQSKKSSYNGSAKVYAPNVEVVPQAKRRRFSEAEKRRILEEADACTEPGEIGALLRREGIYSSYLADWRRGRGWRIAGWAGAALSLLLAPLVAMQVSAAWNWRLFDFGFAFALLFGTGLTYELVASKMNNRAYKGAVGVAVGTALLLVWCNAAVGLIGDDSAANLLYLGVLGVGLLGALSTRFTPQGMARTTFAMAIAQLLVPVMVLLIPNLRPVLLEPPGVVGVFGLNLFFAALFVGAALLFRQAAQAQQIVSPRTD